MFADELGRHVGTFTSDFDSTEDHAVSVNTEPHLCLPASQGKLQNNANQSIESNPPLLSTVPMDLLLVGWIHGADSEDTRVGGIRGSDSDGSAGLMNPRIAIGLFFAVFEKI